MRNVLEGSSWYNDGTRCLGGIAFAFLDYRAWFIRYFIWGIYKTAAPRYQWSWGFSCSLLSVPVGDVGSLWTALSDAVILRDWSTGGELSKPAKRRYTHEQAFSMYNWLEDKRLLI